MHASPPAAAAAGFSCSLSMSVDRLVFVVWARKCRSLLGDRDHVFVVSWTSEGICSAWDLDGPTLVGECPSFGGLSWEVAQTDRYDQ